MKKMKKMKKLLSLMLAIVMVISTVPYAYAEDDSSKETSEQVVGIITNSRGSQDMKNMITAYGITELQNRIEQMANGREKPYTGIFGVNVTREASLQLNVPYGAYITEIDMDSPAMLAGIQQGDIIVAINGNEVTSYNMYVNTVSGMNVGDNLKVQVLRQVQEEYKEMEFDVILEERN